jgi:hypothetical protein
MIEKLRMWSMQVSAASCGRSHSGGRRCGEGSYREAM